jgi:hypothetical protein
MIKSTFFYLSLIITVAITVLDCRAADIYVSLNGADTNLGTKEKPLATLHAAIRKARELRRLKDETIVDGIRIWLKAGIYPLQEPILLYPEDSGTKESPTQIAAFPDERATLSGGLTLSRWRIATGNILGLPKQALGKVWVTDAPSSGNDIIAFRQMWVNGNKAVRARNTTEAQMQRIISWDFDKQTCQIPFSKNINYAVLEGSEMLIHQWWAIANLRIKKATVNGSTVELSFMQPESRIQSEHPWPAPWISTETGNSAFYLSNNLQFLDQPGEWYEDVVNHKVYYWPRKGEQLSTAEAIVPILETLVKVSGTIDRPMQYLTFKNIAFEHSTWLRPSKMGHVPLQAGMFLLDAYKLKIPGTSDKSGLENQAWVGRPPAAVEVKYANGVDFQSCKFEHMASTGLDYQKGTQNCAIKGNLFKDIGGSGILIGTFSDESTEAHLPYQPTDGREVSTNDKIENNLITNVSNEDWGTVGIGAGYVRGIQILNNEINEVSYTGISLGWGWTATANAMKDNVVSRNKITHYGKKMYDVAGIYTLSAQPGSLISENHVDSIYEAKYAHLPEHWFYIYTDEGTAGFTVKNNWTPAQKYLQNANGPGNVWRDNGPQVEKNIKNNAGLSPAYQYLRKEKSSAESEQSINIAGQKVIVEMVFVPNSPVPITAVKTFCKLNNIPSTAIFSWKNRVIIYTESKKPAELQTKLAANLKADVRLYDQTFYDFQRKRDCKLDTAKEWDHIILSANLVKDEKLQGEYLDYHANQFNQWPEIAKGFCNAEFQQLVMYRNGRQLMLIISIPKGKSLNELNPKTTENNPRVDEWNALMKKYQEGIPGTKPGEVWVFFEQVN